MPTGAARFDPAPRGRAAQPGTELAPRVEPGVRGETGVASWGRPRTRTHRGNVRNAVLALLVRRPRHGYEIIQEINARSAGQWRPSPGSVYPTIARLEGEELVRTEPIQGRRVVHLTEQGHRYAADHAEQLAAVFEQVRDLATDECRELRQMADQVGTAVAQVDRAGTDHQMRLAREVLADTRRRLYRILADDLDPLRP